MKKSLIFALVLVIAVAVAVPAFAFRIEGAKDTKFYLGGVALTDIGVWHMDKEVARRSGYTNNSADVDQFFLTVPRHSRLRASVQSGNTGAYWELGMGRDLRAGHEEADGAAILAGQRTNYIETRKIYGWYTFGNCTFTAGKNDGSFVSILPFQNLGFENNNHVLGLGWGALYDDRSAQIRFSQNVSKFFSYQISLVQPFYTDLTVGGVNYDTIAKYPRIDAMMTMDWGTVRLTPAVTFANYYYDNNPPGYDTSANAWAVQLPVTVKAGAFTFAGQLGYAQNVFQYNLQSAFWRPQYDATGKVKNTTGLYGFADFAFTAGAVTPHFYIGYDAPENTDIYVGDKKNERVMYGIGVNWKLADNFFVVPEFTMYDYGKNPALPGNPSLGKEWLGGIQFQFVF